MQQPHKLARFLPGAQREGIEPFGNGRRPHPRLESSRSQLPSSDLGHLLHEVVEAPIDEATQDPMVLEVCGRLTQVNGQPVGIGWYRDVGPTTRLTPRMR